MLGHDGQAEERAGQDPAAADRLAQRAQGEAEAHDVLWMEELHDGAARGGKEGQEDEQPGQSRRGVGLGCAQERPRASRQHQPPQHAQQALGSVPGRRDHTRAGRATCAAFVDVGAEVRIVHVRALLVQRGGPARREAPRRRADDRGERSHERRGEERVARRGGQSVLGGGGVQLPRGQGGGDGGERRGVAARWWPLAGQHDGEVTGRTRNEEQQAQERAARHGVRADLCAIRVTLARA